MEGINTALFDSLEWDEGLRGGGSGERERLLSFLCPSLKSPQNIQKAWLLRRLHCVILHHHRHQSAPQRRTKGWWSRPKKHCERKEREDESFVQHDSDKLTDGEGKGRVSVFG